MVQDRVRLGRGHGDVCAVDRKTEGSQAKPSQANVLTGAETCAKLKLTFLCLLAIPAFDRITGLSNRHLNSSRGLCSR